MVKKDFMFSPGDLELEATLDQQLYHHGDTITINISIKNNSNKMVKKISAQIMQCIDVAMFTGGHGRARVAGIETTEGCPISPGSTMNKVSLTNNCTITRQLIDKKKIRLTTTRTLKMAKKSSELQFLEAS
jgi:hypothetical protein